MKKKIEILNNLVEDLLVCIYFFDRIIKERREMITYTMIDR